MKKCSLYFDKNSKYVTIMLNSLDVFKKRYIHDQLLKIFDLFNGSQICARVVKNIKSTTFFDLKYFHIESIARTRNNEILAFRFKQKQLEYFLNYAVQNEERIEVFLFDEIDWDRFVNLKSDLDKMDYRVLFVINDNNDTYVRFNSNFYDVEYIKDQIDQVLK